MYCVRKLKNVNMNKMKPQACFIALQITWGVIPKLWTAFCSSAPTASVPDHRLFPLLSSWRQRSRCKRRHKGWKGGEQNIDTRPECTSAIMWFSIHFIVYEWIGKNKQKKGDDIMWVPVISPSLLFQRGLNCTVNGCLSALNRVFSEGLGDLHQHLLGGTQMAP